MADSKLMSAVTQSPRAAPNGPRSALAPHAPPAQTNPVHLGYGCTGWGNHLSIESNGPQRISVSHPGSHFGRFRRPAGYGVMGGRLRRSPHPQEPPQAGSAAQRRPVGAQGAGRWARVVAGRAESTPPCHLTQPIISSVRPGGRGRQGRGPGARHPPVGKKRAFSCGKHEGKNRVPNEKGKQTNESTSRTGRELLERI